MADTRMADGTWSVYIIEATDGRFYTGITTDIQRRWAEHSGEPERAGKKKKGAKFFSGRKPKQLLFLEQDHNRSSASKREAALKKLSRREKENFLDEAPTLSTLILSTCQ